MPQRATHFAASMAASSGPILTGTVLIGLVAWPAVTAADCTCRAGGHDYELGRTICLPTPGGSRLATCGMVLNNTSWSFSQTPCVLAAAKEDDRLPEHSSTDHLAQPSRDWSAN